MSQNNTNFEILRDLFGDPYHSFKDTFLEINQKLLKGLVLRKDSSLEIKKHLEDDTLGNFINRHLFLSKCLISETDCLKIKDNIIKIEYMESFLCSDDEIYLIPLKKNNNGTLQKDEDLSETIYPVDLFFSLSMELKTQSKFSNLWNKSIDGIWIKIVPGQIRKNLLEFFKDFKEETTFKELLKPENFINCINNTYGHDKEVWRDLIDKRLPLWSIEPKFKTKQFHTMKIEIEEFCKKSTIVSWGFNDILEISLLRNEIINPQFDNEKLIKQVQNLKIIANQRMKTSLNKFIHWNGL